MSADQIRTPRRTAIDARVERVDHICCEHVKVTCSLTTFPSSSPGQFLQLLCRNDAAADMSDSDRLQDWPGDGFPSLAGREMASHQPLLRRPFSIADRWDDAQGTHLCVISRNVGVGTHWLDSIQEGSVLNLTGPLGRGFRLPDADRPVLLVGGGVGIPPLLYAARCLHETGHHNVRIIFGAMSEALFPVPMTDAPASDGTPRPCLLLPGGARYEAVVTTDDGSAGMKGRVTDAMKRSAISETPLVLACGPDAMLRAVAELTRSLDWPAQLCIERNMGCGIGTCLSCVVRHVDAERPEGWRWALACTDGPVFARDDLVEYIAGRDT